MKHIFKERIRYIFHRQTIIKNIVFYL